MSRRSALGQFFIEHAELSNSELREKIAKTFPGTELNPVNFSNYRVRARKFLAGEAREKTKKKPKAQATAARPPEVDLLETPDAKQLTALVMRVGLNTAEQVMARLKHIESKQQR